MVAAAPLSAVSVAIVAMLAMGAAGRHPMWRVQMMTLSEAAAVHDVATIVWLIEQGRDPNHPYPVARGMLDRNRAPSLTPLEAPVEARRVDVDEPLVRKGAHLDEAQRIAFACRARSRGGGDPVGYFEPPGAVTCGELEAR